MNDDTIFKISRMELDNGEVYSLGDMYATKKQITDEFVIFEMHQDSPQELIHQFINAVKKDAPDLKFLVTAGHITVRKLICEEII